MDGREAYSLLGPNIPRHYSFFSGSPSQASIRGQTGESRGGSQWSNTIDQLPEFNTFDQQDALVLLAYLLRAEQCRRSDTYSHLSPICNRNARSRRQGGAASSCSNSTSPGADLSTPVAIAASPHRRPPAQTLGFQFEREPLVKGDERFLFRRPFESLKGANRRMDNLRERQSSESLLSSTHAGRHPSQRTASRDRRSTATSRRALRCPARTMPWTRLGEADRPV